MEAHDVVVIGAGLAGLRCAVRLAEAGRQVLVLEAEDAVGGRERTDLLDGFQLDRGFHVLNPAYPAVKRWVDLDTLGLQPFPVGVRVRRQNGIVELHHPLRHPIRGFGTLASGMVSIRDAAALLRWTLPAVARPRSVITGSDRSLQEGWDRVGLHGSVRTEVLEPFFAGVLADDRGDTSDAFARLLARMFAIGRPGLPAAGIGALPAQLAASAKDGGAQVRLRARVKRMTRRADRFDVDVTDGDTLRAEKVVVAVGPGATSDLSDLPRPATKGLQTWWFAATTAPTTSALISVDGRRNGPIVNTVVISNAAPRYAPAGSHLIQATCLLPDARTTHAEAIPRESEVRRQLGEIWNADVSSWRLLRRDDIPDALPAQLPPLRLTHPARLDNGLFIAGDYRDTASIQGALVSGDRVARAVLAG
ncbi:FAD-dependent oxidoreductase [Glaciibacter flavus]|uniref:FAD-dependent oxidoreductase n=1 Tax=Orlajensenia flava TaxID=2565934 RepID=A0A4S4FVS2_9MICO|nr:NAD(P)/FAD-dependent oxidoreductase [Glaciibacter flavus]THG33975.1 FAD-dependent oxidoreductase [Glaciibacter flavus]